MQDARGAIRSIIRMESRHSLDFPEIPYPFRIDVNKIFVGGGSAGSIAALQTVYYPEDSQVAEIFPTPAGKPTIKDVLGSIDADYYYGDSTLNIWNNIKGCVNLWGQVLIPVSYTGNEKQFFVDHHVNMVPMIAFHGKLDETLPINITPLVFPPNTTTLPYNYRRLHSESNCLKNGLTYVLAPYNSNIINILGGGSEALYNIFHGLNKTIECYVDCDMGHDIKDYTRDNFGINATSEYDVYLYIVQRTCTFLQAVLLGKEMQLGRDLFFECVNQRVKAITNTTCNCLPDNPVTCTQNCSFDN